MDIYIYQNTNDDGIVKTIFLQVNMSNEFLYDGEIYKFIKKIYWGKNEKFFQDEELQFDKRRFEVKAKFYKGSYIYEIKDRQ